MSHTQAKIEDYALHLQAMFERYDGVRSKLGGLRAEKSYAEQLQPDKVAELGRAIAGVQQSVGRMEEAICKVARRPSVEAARELLVDLKVGLEAVNGYHSDWRRARAQFELDCTTGRYQAEPVARAADEQRLTRLKLLYEQQLVQVGALVPPTSTMVLV